MARVLDNARAPDALVLPRIMGVRRVANPREGVRLPQVPIVHGDASAPVASLCELHHMTLTSLSGGQPLPVIVTESPYCTVCVEIATVGAYTSKPKPALSPALSVTVNA